MVEVTDLAASLVVSTEESSCSSYETKMPVCGPVSVTVKGCVPAPSMPSSPVPSTPPGTMALSMSVRSSASDVSGW